MKITYYAATSIDGYIATPSGGLDWLPAIQADGEDFGYFDFFNSVDGLLMGRGTYDLIERHDTWMYGSKPCWVWTTRELKHTFDDAEIYPTTASPATIIADAERRRLAHLWLIGGGNLAAQFHQHGLIDTFIISVMPVLLGDGIPLIEGESSALSLQHTETTQYTGGVVQLTYQTTAQK